MRALLAATSLGVVLVIGGCVQPKTSLVVRDSWTAARVKTVAVMPFLDAQLQSAFDPHYKGSGSSFVPALQFDALARKTLSPRFEVIGQDRSLEALNKEGIRYTHIEGAWKAVKDPESIRWGYTIAQSLAAGRQLGADAVLLAAQGQYFEAKNMPIQALSMRLVDVRTGKTLWGVSAKGKPGLFSQDKVIRELLSRIVKEAP